MLPHAGKNNFKEGSVFTGLTGILGVLSAGILGVLEDRITLTGVYSMAVWWGCYFCCSKKLDQLELILDHFQIWRKIQYSFWVQSVPLFCGIPCLNFNQLCPWAL